MFVLCNVFDLSNFIISLYSTSYVKFMTFNLFQSPNIYKAYMEEMKDGRIPYKDSPELMYLMLDYANLHPSSFDKLKVINSSYYNCIMHCG